MDQLGHQGDTAREGKDNGLGDRRDRQPHKRPLHRPQAALGAGNLGVDGPVGVAMAGAVVMVMAGGMPKVVVRIASQGLLLGVSMGRLCPRWGD